MSSIRTLVSRVFDLRGEGRKDLKTEITVERFKGNFLHFTHSLAFCFKLKKNDAPVHSLKNIPDYKLRLEWYDQGVLSSRSTD